MTTVPRPKTPCLGWELGHASSMYKLLHHERADYSVVVMNRAVPPKAWRWELYRAGNANPIAQSSIYFDTTVSAERAGKIALTELLNRRSKGRRKVWKWRRNSIGYAGMGSENRRYRNQSACASNELFSAVRCRGQFRRALKSVH